MIVDANDLKILKSLYEKAVTGEVFEFKGEKVLKEYAKYIIEYLESKKKTLIPE